MNIFYNIIFITSVFGMNNGNAFNLPKPNIKHNTILKSVNDLYTSYYSPASKKEEDIFVKEEQDKSVVVQGSSLRTWSYRSPLIEKVQVVLSSEGRPLMRMLNCGMVLITHLVKCAYMQKMASLDPLM